MEQNRPKGEQLSPEQICQLYGLPERDHAAWRAYMHIFSSPWFTRTWVIQEVALASHAMVRFGLFAFEWGYLRQSFVLLCRLQPVASRIFSTQGTLNMHKIISLCDMHRRERSFVSLLYALILTRDFRVSDLRDKIIGILGLVNEKPLNNVPPFRPDYMVSVEKLYHRFAVHLVDVALAQPMLNLSGLQRRALDTESIPTWTPDWSAQTREFGPAHLAMVRPVGYAASRYSVPSSSLAAPGPDVEPDILIMNGECIDTIDKATDALSFFREGSLIEEDAQASQFLTWHSATKALMAEDAVRITLSSIYVDSDEAFVRTILGDDLYTGGNATTVSSPITDLKAVHQTVMNSVAAVSEGRRRPDDESNLVLSATGTFYMQMFTVCHQHRFALTKRGYMGLVPHCARVGDRIAIFLGAPVPFVLRTTGERIGKQDRVTMHLVGDAYIHGIMDGEAMDFEGFAPQEIWLR